MANRAPDLAAVAESLADHTPVDWEAMESGTGTLEDRQRLTRPARRGPNHRRLSQRRRPGSQSGDRRPVGTPATRRPVGEPHHRRTPRQRDVWRRLSRPRSAARSGRRSEAPARPRRGARRPPERRGERRTPAGSGTTPQRRDRLRRRLRGRARRRLDGAGGRALARRGVGERGSFPPGEVSAIGGDLCRALSAVHDAGVLHRDVKAQNVMRDARNGRVVLMDFSAGRESAEPGDRNARLPGTLAGSPIYLAPEILEGQRASAAQRRLQSRRSAVSTGERSVSGRRIVDRGDQGRPCLEPSRNAGRPLSRAPCLCERSDRTRDQRRPARTLQPRRARWNWPFSCPTAATALALGGRSRPGGGTGRRARVGARGPSAHAAPAVCRARLGAHRALREPHGRVTSSTTCSQPALERELTTSGYVNVVPRARVEDTLALMHKPLDIAARHQAGPRGESARWRHSRRASRARSQASRGSQLMCSATDIVDPVDRGPRWRRSAMTWGQDQSDLLPRIRREASGACDLRRRFGEITAVARAQQEPGRRSRRRRYRSAATLLEGGGAAGGRASGSSSSAWAAAGSSPPRACCGGDRARSRRSRRPGCSGRTPPAGATGSRRLPDCLPEAERALQGDRDGDACERRLHRRLRRAPSMRSRAAPGGRSELMDAARAYEALLQFVPDHYWTLMELESPCTRELGRMTTPTRIDDPAAAIRPHSRAIRRRYLARVHLRRRDRAALEAARRARPFARACRRGCRGPTKGPVSLDITWMRTLAGS